VLGLLLVLMIVLSPNGLIALLRSFGKKQHA
jgi:ABC-type branched-subunit amino acid transport system permease subunit